MKHHDIEGKRNLKTSKGAQQKQQAPKKLRKQMSKSTKNKKAQMRATQQAQRTEHKQMKAHNKQRKIRLMTKSMKLKKSAVFIENFSLSARNAHIAQINNR